MPLYDAERNKKKPYSADADEEKEEGASESKKRKLEAEGVVDEDKNGGENSRVTAGEDGIGGGDSDVKPEKTFVTGVPLLTMPGHTGYLGGNSIEKKIGLSFGLRFPTREKVKKWIV